MTNEIFADGVGSILITGTLVRIDLFSLSAGEREPSGAPKMQFRQRIVMPVDGFLHSAAKVQEAAQALMKLGMGSQDPRSGKVTVGTVGTVPAASHAERTGEFGTSTHQTAISDTQPKTAPDVARSKDRPFP